jgi:hypothetical protein
VTTVTVVWLAEMDSVVVPPLLVRIDEMTGDEANGTVVVPPLKVTSVTEVGVEVTTEELASGELSTK